MQARVVVHEAAHHVLMSEVSGDLFGEHVRYYYDDDPALIRHQIARMTEALCFRRLKS